jgi:hypothetical protein
VSVPLALAAGRDRWEPRLHRVAENLGWPQAWLREFQTYLRDPRMTQEEFWVRYTLKRMEAAPAFRAITSEPDALAFYMERDYLLWRQVVYRRRSAWHRVVATMRSRRGTLLEVGCGIAPVSAWCAARRPEWQYALWDLLDAPHTQYGLWRVLRRAKSAMIVWPDQAEVITALEVFEHLADPLKMAVRCVATLAPGGSFHWNFVETEGRELDLATAAQRRETMAYLAEALETVWREPGFTVARKRR